MEAGIYIYAFNFMDRNTAKPMSRNLIMIPSWIGDCVLALSVVHNKILNENADVALLVPPHLVSLCAQLTSFTIIPYKRKTRGELHATLTTVKAKKFSKVYVLPQSFSSAWFSFRSRIKLRRGVSRELREIFFNEPLPRKLRTSARHITYEYALVLETAYSPPDYWPGVWIDKSALSAGAIILCPGSKYGPTKKWPWYSELVEKLPEKKIILLGDKDERETGEAIENSSNDRVLNLIGKTSLTEAASLIAGSRLVIANDSGLMHLAGFVGTPVVGIFGSTSAAWTRPLGKKTRIAATKCGCDPCFRKKCRHGHYNCLKNITADQVAGLARQLL